MFSHLFNAWKAKRLRTVMRAANGYLEHESWEEAKVWVDRAIYFTITSRVHQRLHIDLMLGWTILAASLKEKGRDTYAERALNMAALLRERFDEGDYYSNFPRAWGLFDG